jgi:hypothetical protein
MSRHLVSLSLALAFFFASPALAQVQDVDGTDPIVIGSTDRVAVSTLTVDGAGVRDVALVAHVHVENTSGPDFAGDAYGFGICRDTAAGSVVGYAFWRPGDKSPEQNPLEADTVVVTGFDAAVSLPATYVVCADKISAGSPSLTAFLRGFNADTAPPATRLSGFSDDDGLVEVRSIDSPTPTALDTIEVDAGESSDVVIVAHLTVQGSDLGGGYRYEFGLCRGAADGPRVGSAFWRPPLAAGFSADTIAITGFDPARSGQQTYVLCANKFDAAAPSLGVSYSGMQVSITPTGTGGFGTQTLDFSSTVTLTSNTRVAVDSIVTSHPGVYDVRLAAHAYLETMSFDFSRYEVALCRDSAAGPVVGRALWRPNRRTTDTNFIADTVTLTGFDAGRTGDTTYVLCARKFDGFAPDADIALRGLVATVPEPGALGAAAAAFAALAAARRRTGR